MIDRYFPQVVAEKSSLPAALHREGESRSVPTQEIEAVLNLLPAPLPDVGCFLDRLTGLWRYEFGVPAEVGGKEFVGAHIWIEVRKLFSVLASVQIQLQGDQEKTYLRRLSDANKHLDALTEFSPMIRLSPEIEARFEVRTGAGGRDADWLFIDPTGARVMLEVKRRVADLYQHSEKLVLGADRGCGELPPPEHDPQILFRSVEQKFAPASPDKVLQGAWIVTNVAQEKTKLRAAFDSLDPARVHFAILNNWRSDAKVLAQRVQDEKYLVSMFSLKNSDKFEFERHEGP